MKPIQKGLIYAIVPARSGSTGVKNKNIKPLAGHPLMAYSIAAGKLTPEVRRVIVSTDSEQYAQIARAYGADVPFLRPAEIAGNMATDLEFMLHAIHWLDEHEDVLPEYWVHLRPTTPLREISVIRSAIGQMTADSTADSLRSAHRTDLCPFKWFWRSEDGYYQAFNGITLDRANGPRQGFPAMYIPDGYVDVLRTEYIVEHHLLHGERMIGFEVPEAVDIDSIREFEETTEAVSLFDNEIMAYLRRCEAEKERS